MRTAAFIVLGLSVFVAALLLQLHEHAALARDLADWQQASRRLVAHAGTPGATDAQIPRFSASSSTAEVVTKLQPYVSAGSFYQLLGGYIQFVSVLSAKDYPRALEVAEKLGRGQDFIFLSYLFKQWAKADPAAAVTYALKQDHFQDSYVQQVLRGWAQVDYDGALAWATQMPPGRQRDGAINAVGLNGLKPADALVATQYFSTANARMNAVSAIFSCLAESHPSAAAALARQLPDPLESYYAQQAVVAAWGPKEPAKTLAWVQALPDGLFKTTTMQDLATRWVENDPVGAVAWMQQLPPGALRQSVFPTIITQWGAHDPQTALEYLATLPKEAAVEALMANVVAHAATQDVPTALKFLAQLPAGTAYDQAAIGVAQAWVKQDQAGSIAWAEALPRGATRNDAIYGLVTGWEHLGSHPEQMAALAQNLPEGDQREIAWKIITMQWTNSDPEAAAQWLSGLEAGHSRDIAAWMFVDGLRFFHPDDTQRLAEAVPLVDLIGSKNRKNYVTTELAGLWLKTDRNAAAAWLAKTDLPDVDKQKLLQQPP